MGASISKNLSALALAEKQSQIKKAMINNDRNLNEQKQSKITRAMMNKERNNK